jgi:hypothetical protein
MSRSKITRRIERVLSAIEALEILAYTDKELASRGRAGMPAGRSASRFSPGTSFTRLR